MSIGRGGPPILGTPHLHDPNAPTLHTCVDCGFQMLIPAGLVPAAVEHHRRGCVGPKLADLREQLALVTNALDQLDDDMAHLLDRDHPATHPEGNDD